MHEDDMEYDHEAEMAETPPPPPAFYTVAPFLVHRAYGGPEEGGWWYDAGEPEAGEDLPLPVIVRTPEEAAPLCKAMQEELDRTVNAGRRPLHSVLSDGRYEARVCENYPRRFPEERPHYE